MKKFIMQCFNGENSVAVVEATGIKDAMVKFANYYGFRYPLNEKDMQNLVKDFTINKFIDWFHINYSETIYGIYEVAETLFEKE